ncbi:MAG: single-stranded-DNA-specific exonuclease RecJ [Calditrichaceae bacterium]
MIYKWIQPFKTDAKKVTTISKQLNINPTIAHILLSREFNSKIKIEKYFRSDLNDLYDPFLIPDMDVAVKRIIKALKKGEHIVIYGDYDVDGVTSVSILYDSLFHLGGKVSFFIPNRFKEGYGVSEEGIKNVINRDASLIITVDCGITAVEEVNYAHEKNIDVIVCDHHEPGEEIPDAVAVLDPKLKDSNYPFKELAGCGVAFKLLQALTSSLGFDQDYAYKYLDLVAIGTAADIVQLLDENRILVKNGLEIINKSPRPGIYALLEIAGLLNRKLTVNSIVFMLAPRLNAVGRISNAKKAVHLLTSKSMQQGKNIARILENENRARKSIDEVTFEEAKEIVERDIDLESKRILVVANQDWHTGVVGIVASRLMEKYNRPAILISIENGIGKGSARSTQNFDIYEAFNNLKELLLNFGGHRYAAGITIKEENIALLDEEINKLSIGEISQEDMTPKLRLDAEIKLDQLNASFFKGLKMLAPFGPNNMRPVFITKHLEICGKVNIVGSNHIKVKFKQNGVVLDAIGYNLAKYIDYFNNEGNDINCAYVLEETKWDGQTTIQMRLKDFEVERNG